MPEGGLRLEGFALRRGTERLVSLDLRIEPGKVVAVMGPSGSGKSSLLAAITGTLDNAFEMQGRILLDGQDVTRWPTEARRIGILFQDHMLFPHLSVADNLAFGLAPQVRRSRHRKAVIEAALVEISLGGFGSRDPETLSGGQKARVALMRTLLSEPRALLLDEPFSGLDADLRDQMRRLVFDHARRRALPVLLVTHDADDARAAGGLVVRLSEPVMAPDAPLPKPRP